MLLVCNAHTIQIGASFKIFIHSLSLSPSVPPVTPLPECTVATQLLEAIKEKKEKKTFEHLTSILDTLSSVQPELENDRDSMLSTTTTV